MSKSRKCMKYDVSKALSILGPLAQKKQLIVFAGSGISVPSGLPNWDEFLKSFIQMAEHLVLDEPHNSELKILVADAKKRPDRDQIQIATVLKNKIKAAELNNNTLARSEYNGWLTKLLISDKKPNNLHRFIVGTNYPYIVTSNYDLLLEVAAKELGFTNLSKNSFTFKEGNKIMSHIHRDMNCIVHIHGLADSGQLPLEEIVMTADDYQKVIRKNFEGFSFALRMLFTRYSTLFVGYGASDPHLEDIAEELVQYYPLAAGSDNEKYPLPRSFLVVTEDRYSTLFDKWKERLRTDIILIKNYDEYNNLLDGIKRLAPRPQLTHQDQLSLPAISSTN